MYEGRMIEGVNKERIEARKNDKPRKGGGEGRKM